MYFRILFDEDEFPSKLYKDYSKFLYKSIKKDIRNSINRFKYLVREPLVLESSLIKWNHEPPKTIDLVYYINNALVLREDHGVYYITLNNKLIRGSSTPISTLVRLLEYGNENIPPLPLIRSILLRYQATYKTLMFNYLREGMIKNESVSVRRISNRRTPKSHW